MSTLREIETEDIWEFLDQWDVQEKEVQNDEKDQFTCDCVPDKHLLYTVSIG